MSYERKLVLAVALITLITASAASDPTPSGVPTAARLVTGMASGSGSTIGPAGDLYVTEGAVGRVLRVDPKTGNVSTFASGLPNSIVGIGAGCA